MHGSANLGQENKAPQISIDMHEWTYQGVVMRSSPSHSWHNFWPIHVMNYFNSLSGSFMHIRYVYDRVIQHDIWPKFCPIKSM